MYILFGWGKNVGKGDLKYEVTDFNASVSSTAEFSGRLNNCVPGQITLNLEIPYKATAKPAKELFEFAKSQHDKAKGEGGGKIVVYEGRDKQDVVQQVEFDEAWITDMSHGVSRHDEVFSLSVTVTAASVTISDVKFVDTRKSEMVQGV
jgi:hypothetical protein